MTFCIVSTGWECSSFIERTVRSIEEQSHRDFRVMIVDDASTDPRQKERIEDWCMGRWPRWQYRINTERLGTVRNQWEAIRLLNPAQDDVIVWCDLDGDRLAHSDVLAYLDGVYSDPDVWLTYGNYKPDPDDGRPCDVAPYPDEVVEKGTYRQFTRDVGTRFNHIRSMRGRVFHSIPDDQFRWAGTNRWYEHAADYVFMLAGLERAGGRYRCLTDHLLTYNAANEKADNLMHPDDTNRCAIDFLRRPPLEPLR